MDPAARIASLSSRERQIARAYAAGNGYRTIAERLFIAPSTVRTHLSTIYRKLEVSSKVDLLRALDRIAEPGQAGAAAMPDALEAMRPRDVTDRRQVTAMSVMLDRFADLAGKLDPEETAAILGNLHKIVAKQVQEYSGALVRTGLKSDQLACFGAPVADETDAERAVNSALAIQDEVSRLDAPTGLILAARIGVFTGPVVTTGSTGYIDEVAGGAPFAATALARQAPGGGIVVCARTQAMTGNLFEFSDLGRRAIEGSSADVHCFAITGVAHASSRFHGLHGDRLTPIVGRDHEIGLVANLFEWSRDGQGRIATISGEAGIGKSRLVQALCERLDIGADDRLVFQCSPYETATALHPVRNWSYHAAGLHGLGAHEARAEALAALFAPVIEDPSLERVLLADLASSRLSDRAAADTLPPRQRRAAMLALLTRFVQYRAEAGPIVLIFEDVHWADPTTLAWLNDLAAMSQTLQVLVVVTFRPEFAFDWADLPNVTSLSLSRLTRRHATGIVKQQPGAGSLSPTLVDQIVERSDGIPLFAEELTRSIVDFEDTLEAVPSTLQASLAARLDRLHEVREVAQAAAVIGREFELDLLRELLSLGKDKVLKAMEKILASKLVLRRAMSDMETYQFRHALVRDSAYDSLVRSKRQSLHRKLAQILSAHRADGREVPAELVAYHFVEGAALEASVGFWIEAARTALARGAEHEATQFCRSGLAAANSIADAIERDKIECDLQQLLYGAEYVRGDVPTLLAILAQAESIASRLDDPARLSKVLDMKAYVLASAGRVSEAIDAGRRAVAISRNLDDLHAVIGANMMLGRALYAAGEYREAEGFARFVRDLLGLDLERGYTFGALNQTVSSRVWLTFILVELGAFEAAGQDIRDALALVEQMAVNDHERVWAAAAFGRLHFLLEDHRGVVDQLEPLLELCERHFPVYFPRMVMSLGPSLVASGQSAHGISLLEQADDLGGAIDFRFGRALLLAEFAQALLSTGDAHRAEETARRAQKVATETGETGNAAWAALAIGNAVSARGRTAEAQTIIGAAAKHALEHDMAPLSRRCDQALRLCG